MVHIKADGFGMEESIWGGMYTAYCLVPVIQRDPHARSALVGHTETHQQL